MTQHMTKTLSGAALDWAGTYASYMLNERHVLPNGRVIKDPHLYAKLMMEHFFGSAVAGSELATEASFDMERHDIALLQDGERWLAIPLSRLRKKACAQTIMQAPITPISEEDAFCLLKDNFAKTSTPSWHVLTCDPLKAWPRGSLAAAHNDDVAEGDTALLALKRCFVALMVGDTIDVPADVHYVALQDDDIPLFPDDYCPYQFEAACKSTSRK